MQNNIYEGFTPMPDDMQGWNSIHPVFGQLIDRTNPKTIIEVGTWKGASALYMADLCHSKSLNSHIYCVDTWLGAVEFCTTLADTPERDLLLRNGYPQIYYQFISNVIHKGHQQRITPVPNTSLNAAKILAYHGVKAELIYIDGSHEYDDVKADIKAYLPLLKPGGIMFGDDYGWQGVQQAVNEMIPHKVIDNNYWIYE